MKASQGNSIYKVTNARKSLESETPLVPHVTSSQPSCVSATAMVTVPDSSNSHPSDSHPPQASEHFSSFSDNGKVQPRNARVLMLSPTPTPARQPATAGHRSWSTNVSASPPLGEHHWETFCTLLRRSQQKRDMLLTTAISKTVLFVFSPPFPSHSHALTPFGSLTCPPLPVCP